MKKYEYKIISRIGEAGLVELLRNDTVERFILPMEVLNNTTALTDAEIDSGVQYGLQFGDFLKPSSDIVARLTVALHNAGIWTIQDLRTKPNDVIRALRLVYGIDVGRIIQDAETYLQQEHLQPPVAPKKTKKEKK